MISCQRIGVVKSGAEERPRSGSARWAPRENLCGSHGLRAPLRKTSETSRACVGRVGGKHRAVAQIADRLRVFFGRDAGIDPAGFGHERRLYRVRIAEGADSLDSSSQVKHLIAQSGTRGVTIPAGPTTRRLRGDRNWRRASLAGRRSSPPVHGELQDGATADRERVRECSRTISPDDTVVFRRRLGRSSRLSSARAFLSAEERTLLIIYCRDHEVARMRSLRTKVPPARGCLA